MQPCEIVEMYDIVHYVSIQHCCKSRPSYICDAVSSLSRWSL